MSRSASGQKRSFGARILHRSARPSKAECGLGDVECAKGQKEASLARWSRRFERSIGLSSRVPKANGLTRTITGPDGARCWILVSERMRAASPLTTVLLVPTASMPNNERARDRSSSRPGCYRLSASSGLGQRLSAGFLGPGAPEASPHGRLRAVLSMTEHRGSRVGI